MKPVKAVIADDEEQLRLHLKKQLQEVWPSLVICGEAGNGIEALDLVNKHRPDIAFLDIKMPGLTGMEVAREISGQCRIVFITAYDEYAVDAFETEAIDYILKPVSRERLVIMARRLKKQLTAPSPSRSQLTDIIDRILNHRKPDKPKYLQWIRAQQGEEIRIIPSDKISYFKANNKYTMVITKDKEFVIKKPIKELEKELDPSRFWRIHRGTIVNASCIAKVSPSRTGRYVLKLKDVQETLTVSRTYTHLFKQM